MRSRTGSNESGKRALLRAVALVLVGMVLSSCSALPTFKPDRARSCPQPRPQICTMRYNPVIGYNGEGEEIGAFSNRCSACAEKGVAWTLPKDWEG